MSLLEKYSMLFERKKSYTTRKIRADEKNPEMFNFISEDQFQKMVDEGAFVEHRQKTEGRYGTSRAELDRISGLGKIPIIEVDVEGAIEINKKAIEGNFLFIYPPSFEELRKRIGNRIETEAQFKVRISQAIKQIELANNSVLFTHRLVNDKLDDAVSQFFTLVQALYFQEIKAKIGTQSPAPETKE